MPGLTGWCSLSLLQAQGRSACRARLHTPQDGCRHAQARGVSAARACKFCLMTLIPICTPHSVSAGLCACTGMRSGVILAHLTALKLSAAAGTGRRAGKLHVQAVLQLTSTADPACSSLQLNCAGAVHLPPSEPGRVGAGGRQGRVQGRCRPVKSHHPAAEQRYGPARPSSAGRLCAPVHRHLRCGQCGSCCSNCASC